DRVGFRCRGGDRGVLGEGSPTPRGDRRAGRGAGCSVTLLALAVGGRGLVDPDEPVLHADDEALLRGRAAFETTRVYAGRPFKLDEHLARLAGSAARIGLPSVEIDECAELARAALESAGEPDVVLRLYWTAGREGDGRATALALVSTI